MSSARARMRWFLWFLWFPVCVGLAGACGADAARKGDAGARDAETSQVQPPDGSTGADSNPCEPEALLEPRVDTIFYLAIGEPGADNLACDGLAPTDEGAGHCPFKDFSSPRTASLLDGKKSTRVELRAGRYVISNWDGLRIAGTGSSEAERVVLSAYGDEKPVLDVGKPDGAGCTEQAAMSTPGCVRQILRITGSFTLVQGLTIQNGLGYHVELNGGSEHVFRCNTLHETVAFPMRSDMLKIDGHASHVTIAHNDFSKFRSQAIDMTNVSDVLIEDNEFHDPIGADAGATGSKYGARRVTIRANRVHDLGSDPMLHAFSLGGTGSEHPDDHTAYEIRVENNRVWNVRGILAQLVSCSDCAVVDNDVWNVGAGVLLSAAATGTAECAAASAGCGANRDAQITGNRFRDLNGGGDAAQSNVFLFVESGEAQGLVVDDNLYCTAGTEPARFGWDGMVVDHAAFQGVAMTDGSSKLLAGDDAECQFETN